MLMPDKTLTVNSAILGIGSDIIKALGASDTIASLWNRFKRDREIAFDRFALALDFLYMIRAIDYNNGILQLGKVKDHDTEPQSE